MTRIDENEVKKALDKKAAYGEDIDLNRYTEGDYEVEQIQNITDTPEDLRKKMINVGFSGGEIKRSELLQLTAQAPDFVMLDEPESGVDLENIGLIGKKVHELIYGKEGADNGGRKVSAFVITHTGQIMDYIGADKAYVLIHGRIAREGDANTILEDIKNNGYGVEDE